MRGASRRRPAYGRHVRDPDDHRGPDDHEGPQPPTPRRLAAVGLLGFVLGVAATGGAVLARQALPEPPRLQVDEHAVELVLFEATPSGPTANGRDSERSPLQVDSAVLLSGLQASTVSSIGTTASQGLSIRAPDLPVTVSPTGRFQSLDLEIVVRDCEAATRWTPGDRPFLITWRDENGRSHTDRAGDFDRSMARSLTRHIDAACSDPPATG